MDCKRYLGEILTESHNINNTLLDLIRNWSHIYSSALCWPKNISCVNNQFVLYLQIKPYAIFEIDIHVMRRKVNMFLCHTYITKIHVISAMY
jgi:hypothetical protein